MGLGERWMKHTELNSLQHRQQKKIFYFFHEHKLSRFKLFPGAFFHFVRNVNNRSLFKNPTLCAGKNRSFTVYYMLKTKIWEKHNKTLTLSLMTFVWVMTIMGMVVCTHRRKQHWRVNLPTKAKPMSVRIKVLLPDTAHGRRCFWSHFSGLGLFRGLNKAYNCSLEATWIKCLFTSVRDRDKKSLTFYWMLWINV